VDAVALDNLGLFFLLKHVKSPFKT
jgi:hypothetical protein